jgi:hypothetical protein
MTDKSLVLLSEADKALATATSIPELRELHDQLAAAKAWAKSRGLGVEAENKASEYILRAERKIGQQIIAMKEEDALRTGRLSGTKPGPDRVPILREDDRPTLAEIGIGPHLSADCQKVAALSDEVFDRMISAARGTRERIAKINFYRTPKSPDAPVPETPENKSFASFQRGAQGMLGWKNGEATKNDLMQLPDDELATLRALVQALVNAYGEAVKARRG